MDKFSEQHLKGLQEFIYKEYEKLPSRCRLFTMTRDLTEGERKSVVYFNAAITILGQMGALKDEALNACIPNIEQRIEQTVWEE